ncbi:unnamed protein product [Clonostachys rhizophaga]|uniref:Transport protein particle subunit trs85-2 n=1 Tax=Clonostachys rhizophaga TaxID=160324 RepID=A0A9N9YLE0_9HYPO|nr:unnamed protein product [Clonostachys rhizophaga]
MTQPLSDDAPPTEPIQALPAPASAAAIKLPSMAHSLTGDPLSMSDSETTIAFRRNHPSAASLYASTLSPPGSRPMSPAGHGSPSRVLSSTIFGPPSGRSLPDVNIGENPGDPVNLMLKAFVPHVAIYASDDVEELAAKKGFQQGFWELLRPFGERIQGKVSVRDSNGVSKIAEEFSLRFTKFGENVDQPGTRTRTPSLMQGGFGDGKNGEKQGPALTRDQKALVDVESVVSRHLSFAEESFLSSPFHAALSSTQGLDTEATSPYYALYLRRLLSAMPIAPHETFTHPVACIVAVTAGSEDSVGELRRIYNETSTGPKKLPPWVDGDYLRFYVLVHDEENDDITRSMALYEQMRRHFGQDCHLLRLRSSQSAETDDDSIPIPRSDWMPAEEELAEIRRSENEEDFEDPLRYIFESDATAIRTFVRELVTLSLLPKMERNVSIWNDQVASRRRGLAGRFMNLSRKWASFGGNSRSSINVGGTDNYDMSGFYRAEAPEAIMRKLADYAFMLRDWRLAYSTYDLLRADFADAKAWKYQAAANEMAALSLLMIPHQLTSKARAETVDQMLESAVYSYHTRCSSPYGAIRSLILGIELLRIRGGNNIDDAGRWGTRLLDLKILGPIGEALAKERLAIAYSCKEGVGSWHWGARSRKSAMWSALAAEAWVKQAKYIPGQRCINHARNIYSANPPKTGISGYTEANQFVTSLARTIAEQLDLVDDDLDDASDEDLDDEIDEESEALTDMRRRRPSNGRPQSVIETAPLRDDGTGENGKAGF